MLCDYKKKGKIVSKGETPLIGLASDRQQSPYRASKSKKRWLNKGKIEKLLVPQLA